MSGSLRGSLHNHNTVVGTVYLLISLDYFGYVIVSLAYSWCKVSDWVEKLPQKLQAIIHIGEKRCFAYLLEFKQSFIISELKIICKKTY